MSLNRSEDALLAYLRANPDEERFWRERVRQLEHSGGSHEAQSLSLERDLRDYAAERARASPALRDAFGAGRVSLRNLAEFVLFSWMEKRPPAWRRGPGGQRLGAREGAAGHTAQNG